MIGREVAKRLEAPGRTVQAVEGVGVVVWNGTLERQGRAPSLVSPDYVQREDSSLLTQARRAGE